MYFSVCLLQLLHSHSRRKVCVWEGDNLAYLPSLLIYIFGRCIILGEIGVVGSFVSLQIFSTFLDHILRSWRRYDAATVQARRQILLW